MLKTYLYIPQQLNQQLVTLAAAQKRPKAELIRIALKEGLVLLKRRQTSSAAVLLRIAELGRKYKPKGPKDLSAKMDDYLWRRPG